MFAGFVLGFHTSRNLGAQPGDHFSFSVARAQMLVAWGDRVPLEHSLGLLEKHIPSNNCKIFVTETLENTC